VIRSFCEAFDDCSLWNGETSNLMLVGTRGATGPATLAHVFAQWQNRTVVRELRALGLERPEQLGALFIGDAPFLKRISAGVPPLVDDRPGRINDRSVLKEYDDALLREMLDPAACRERFRTSAFIQKLWPPELIEATLPFFEFQALINGVGGYSQQSMDAVHRVLTGSMLKTPVLWLLGSNGDLQRGVEIATAVELAQPPMQYHLAARLVSERSYFAAAAAFGRAEAEPALKERALGMRLYSLCLAGQTEDALTLALARRAEITSHPFWVWLGRTCDVLPPPA
jgi:hypothetical protein